MPRADFSFLFDRLIRSTKVPSNLEGETLKELFLKQTEHGSLQFLSPDQKSSWKREIDSRKAQLNLIKNPKTLGQSSLLIILI